MKWNFLYQMQLPPESLTRGLLPQIPILSLLCPQLNLLNPPPNKIPRYATGDNVFEMQKQCFELCVLCFPADQRVSSTLR